MTKQSKKPEPNGNIDEKKLFQNRWEGVLAISIAFLSLVISIFSYFQAQKSLTITQKDFEGKRSVIWQGDYIENPGAMSISPVDVNVTMQSVYVYFPSEYYTGRVFVTANIPKDSIYLDGPACMIGGELRRTYQRDGHLSIERFKLVFPIAIKATYTTEGELFEDTSVYYIQNELNSFDPEEENCSSQTIHFIKLLYARRLDPEIDDNTIHLILNQEWTRIAEELAINSCGFGEDSCWNINIP